MSVLFNNNAITTLASGISVGAVSLSVSSGTGALFPTIANSLDFFYVRLGTDVTNEVVKVTARSTDTLTCVATVGAWSTGTQVALVLNKETLDHVPTMLRSDITVTVKASGGDFTTLEAALTALKETYISPNATVTVEIDDTTGLATTTLDSNNVLSPERILITGKNTYSKTMSSVQSTSGSSGAWSYVINVNNVTSVVAGDYAIVSTLPTGGTNPELLLGCHEVASVDAVNNRLTLTVKHRTASAPSSTVSATVNIIKTVLTFSAQNGVAPSNGARAFKGIQKLVLKGSATAGTYGMYIADNAAVKTTGLVGVVNFAVGIRTAACGVFRQGTNNTLAISGNTGTGFQSVDYSGAYVAGITVTGNGGDGIFANIGSGILAANALVVANTSNGIIAADAGSIHAGSALAKFSSTDLYAGTTGYVLATSATYTTTSPAVNTLGNENGYINT